MENHLVVDRSTYTQTIQRPYAKLLFKYLKVSQHS